MENLIIVLSCLLSFFLGAYIREPFLFTKKEIKKEIISDEKQKEEKIQKEWNNLLNYTGKEKENDNED